MKKYEQPYAECETCKILDDCNHVEVAMDGMGTPLPPDVCPRPMEIMKQTLHKHQLRNSKS